MSRYRHVESLPLMNNQSALDDQNMTDEELDDLMQTPLALEGVLEHMRYHPHTVTRQQYFKGTLFFSLLSLVFGVIVAYVSCGFLCDMQRSRTKILDAEETEWTHKIISYTDENSIQVFLRNLTSGPLLGGSPADKQSADYVSRVWQDQGLDVKIVPYKVLLSYPNRDKPNLVKVISRLNNSVLFSTSISEKPLYSEEESREDVPPPFLAYSASTTEPLVGELIYANYGRHEDFRRLISLKVEPSDKIAIVRYGKIYRGNKIRIAESYNVKGVILYCDPIDYAPKGPRNVYPHSEYLPPSGVQRGTLLIEDGDPTTPFYPSVESAYRIPQDKMSIPRIPAHVISYGDAAALLRFLGGREAPKDWIGGLNLTYRLGPGFHENDSVKLQMEVNVKNTYKTTYNVIGTIQGKDEPDRFVLVGNHRDAWTFGGTDPSSGTAAMLEMSRVFGKLLKEGWKPRRSIVFCSWGSEEYGLIGSTEWVEENQKKLTAQAVAYLNVDISVTGNHTLLIKSVPLLHQVFLKATKKIPNPNLDEIRQGRVMLFDTWLYYSKTKLHPKIEDIGAGSDFSPFIHTLGISSADLTFTCKEDLVDCYPVYHTLYDTFHLQEKILDQGFHFNKALTRLWAEATRSLADSTILPFSVTDLARTLNNSLTQFLKVHQEHLNHCNISMVAVREAVDQFSAAASKFQKSLQGIDHFDLLAVRRVNDALMHLERAFINYQGLPMRKNYRHVIFAPDAMDAYNGSVFGGLLDIFYESDLSNAGPSDDLHAKAARHVSAIAFHIHAAKGILEDMF